MEEMKVVIYSPYSPGRDNGGDLWFDSELLNPGRTRNPEKIDIFIFFCVLAPLVRQNETNRCRAGSPRVFIYYGIVKSIAKIA
jgi:hypothetical protein